MSPLVILLAPRAAHLTRERVSRWSRQLAWMLLAIAVAVAIAGAPVPAALARLFFLAAFGAGGLFILHHAGARAQLTLTGSLCLLLLALRLVDRPLAEPPSSQWTAALAGPEQIIRHEMLLPVGSPAWERLWQRATAAAVFVCARGPLAHADGLQLFVNEQLLGIVTQEEAIGPRPQPTSIGFYRVPVSRALLEQRQPVVFRLQRAPEAPPDPVEICGTFTYKPTAGLASSARFDGHTWTSPGLTQRGRYLIELRLEDRTGRTLAAIY